MKILLVNKFFYIKGGAETVYFQEREMLKQAGVEVIDFSMQHEKNFPSDYADYFVSNVDYHKGSNLLGGIKTAIEFIHNNEACKKMKALLEKERPDIVHFHNIYHQLTPSIIKIARDFGCKTVLTAHDYKIACPSYAMLRDGKVCDACITGSVFNAFKYRCYEGSASKSLLLTLEATWQYIAKNYQALDVIISPSEFLRGIIRHTLPNSRIEVIVNGIDDSQPFEGIEDHGYLLFVGRISPEKGIQTLAQAHELMRNKIPLKIVGHGPIYHDLMKQFPQAEFLGYVQQGEGLDSLIKHARAIVVPSECNENCSMSVLEAMSFARPIVGSRIGGIPEQIRDGVDGALFEPGNAQELANILDFLAENPDKAHHMGLNAHQRLCDKYAMRNHMEALLNLYQELLSKP
ncbi:MULTISPECIES: glycosyltransferase family 4 protein [Buttiauxella]|jgi:glycosyltransferase involved in cell wall biosynthesis|uniref:Glycosyltransferase protein n=1 Tax=Buttiauxella ferragutiae ATCC 51602 TaxID=1354252 RepID=A0ABX2W6L6_9ENTR|nr:MULTISPECIES: glycosyltransferase family 4 protein [Buttiauxella]AYN26512.1 glycosyltransferase family 1 protein [Buttiauxella sp. 3AFRM03]MCE0828701.1 glycosyltransferase family 4 protein [Buttiauxella ferragutiae]OAT26579.1 putative glycosyltransferase protein [Buttiauxella ferragutiae ATCC 51602]TDN54793.1 glycosyltransferase involved in cell wall biosynthesis [Buttiauxella sp. JUb87]UNK63253.1 glycosyltransferase family 4 protein [Buttiauxella ferragutiae]